MIQRLLKWFEGVPKHECQEAALRAELEGVYMAHQRLGDELESLRKRNSELEFAASAAGRHRVCSVKIDPVRLTAQLRGIDPTLRAEYDGSRLVVYSDYELPETKVNAAVAKLNLVADRT